MYSIERKDGIFHIKNNRGRGEVVTQEAVQPDMGQQEIFQAEVDLQEMEDEGRIRRITEAVEAEFSN